MGVIASDGEREIFSLDPPPISYHLTPSESTPNILKTRIKY